MWSTVVERAEHFVPKSYSDPATFRRSFCLFSPATPPSPGSGGLRSFRAFHTELFNLGLGKMLNSHERVLRGAGANQLVQLCLDGRAVAIFWVFWIRNTIKKVTIVVPVLMTNCHVSEKPKNGPLTAQTITTMQQIAGRSLARQLHELQRWKPS